MTQTDSNSDINGQSIGIMENKNLALMAELKEQLKKARAAEDKFERARQEQEYQLRLKSAHLKMETEIVLKQIDNLNVECIEKYVPKYFRVKTKNKGVIVTAFKTREIVSDSQAISVKVDNIALYQDDDMHESHFSCGYGEKLFLAYSIDDALNMLDADYTEITEDEYNKLKALSIEALVNGQIAEPSEEKADEIRSKVNKIIGEI